MKRIVEVLAAYLCFCPKCEWQRVDGGAGGRDSRGCRVKPSACESRADTTHRLTKEKYVWIAQSYV